MSSISDSSPKRRFINLLTEFNTYPTRGSVSMLGFVNGLVDSEYCPSTQDEFNHLMDIVYPNMTNSIQHLVFWQSINMVVSRKHVQLGNGMPPILEYFNEYCEQKIQLMLLESYDEKQ